jgi:hypothetical protein
MPYVVVNGDGNFIFEAGDDAADPLRLALTGEPNPAPQGGLRREPTIGGTTKLTATVRFTDVDANRRERAGYSAASETALPSGLGPPLRITE